MRIVKNGVERKEEFLTQSLELFLQKGYENTSVNDILKAVGVSKGAFYYYFETKEEVLDALVIRQTEKLLALLTPIALQQNSNALQKLNSMIVAAYQFRAATMQHRLKLMKAIGQVDNFKFHHKAAEKIVAMSLPLLTELISQGNEQGLFQTDFPGETAELYSRLCTLFNSQINQLYLQTELKEQEKMKILQDKLHFFQQTLERLLGAKPGTIELAKPILQFLFPQKD